MDLKVDSARRLFAAWLERTIADADRSGLVGRIAVRALRDVRAKTTVRDRAAVMASLGQYLPDFDAWSPVARQAIEQAIAEADRFETTGDRLGAWYARTTTFLLWIHARLSAHDAGAVRRTAANAFGFIAFSWRAGALLTTKRLVLSMRYLRGRMTGRWTLFLVLAKAGVNAQEFVNLYARGVKQNPSYRGPWRDASRNNSVGLVLGIDFIPSERGYLVIECNLGAAMSEKRSRFYASDPLIENLFEFADRRGFAAVTVLNSESIGIDRLLRSRYAAEARKYGIELTLYDRKFAPSRHLETTAIVPEFRREYALTVRIFNSGVSVDYLLDNKSVMLAALRRKLESRGDVRFRLPEAEISDAQLASTVDNRFPNLVYKLADLDAGTGVLFLNVASRQAAEVAIQRELVRPSIGSLRSRILRRFSMGLGEFQLFEPSNLWDGRYLYKIRSHVLLTPAGCAFLSAQAYVNTRTIPDRRLPEGLIEDPSVFIVNNAAGAEFADLAEAELSQVRAASIDVADSLLEVVAEAFDLST